MSTASRLPHPIPYQGSKRRLAPQILRFAAAHPFQTIFEPFAGSGAVSIAAAHRDMARRLVIGDSLSALSEIWSEIVSAPNALADSYEDIWTAQLADPPRHYLEVRDAFNAKGGTGRLLYLLARCVKNSPRFNSQGEFNQSPDHRRKGMSPLKMRRELRGAHTLLRDRTDIRAGDFVEQLADATTDDLVYLDPPWEGTTVGTDRRYHRGLPRERLIDALKDLDERGVPYLLSYDGRHGTKSYGDPLPECIGAAHIEIEAGRSSQATLNGKAVATVESLYVSRHLGDAFVPAQLALLEPAA